MKMKNYGKLVPVILIFFMFLATYKMISDAKEKEQEYNGYLETAREMTGQGILVDAFQNYEKAIAMYPSLALYEETGAMIEDLGSYKQRISWGEQMVADYPDAGEGYEYLISVYLEQERYASCFEIYDVAKKKEAVTEEMQEMMAQIEYKYEFDYYVYEDIGVFAGGYCAVCRDGKWGYVGEKATLKIRCKYREAGVFAGGLAYVRDAEDELYFINTNDEKKLPVDNTLKPQIEGILNEGLYPVMVEEEYYYCNEAGETVLGPFMQAASFNLGKAAVLTKDGWTFIDTAGNILTQNTYMNVMLDKKGIAFRNGRAFVETEEGIRMIDENFLPVGEDIYEAAVPFYEAAYAAVKTDGRWGFIDSMGNMVIPCSYEAADSFANGYAAVCVEEKWGYINVLGETAIEPVFAAAAPFTAKGCAFVRRGEEWVALRLIKDNW